MISFFSWALKNSWNLFGAVGVIGTFYFSLAYVPDYVHEITSGKINVVHESLMDDIQEMVFHEKELTIENVKSFIKGEELKYKVSYPYSPDELLVQVQESFMGNKFIPLEERNRILREVSGIRAEYKSVSQDEVEGKGAFDFDYATLASVVASLLGISLSIFGAISIKRKNELDRQTEIDIAGDLDSVYRSDLTASYYEFEQMVGSTLSEAGFREVEVSGNNDFGIDFSVNFDGSEYYVCVKKYRSLLGMSSLLPFIHALKESGKNGIFVISSGVTKRVQNTVNEFNETNAHQSLHLVIGNSKNMIKNQLISIANEDVSNK